MSQAASVVPGEQRVSPDHRVSLGEWDRQWSRREGRYEFVDGIPRMAPSEHFDNVRAAWRLGHLIEQATAGAALAVPTFDVVLREAPLLLRVPDLIVVRAHGAPRGNRANAAHVLLAMEVLSESTRQVDQGAKRAEYAAAGIPNYLMVDVRARRPEGADTFTLLTDPRPATGDQGADYAAATRGEALTLRLSGHEIPITAADLHA